MKNNNCKSWQEKAKKMLLYHNRYWYVYDFHNNTHAIEYCPFCGSELDSEGCTLFKGVWKG